MQGGVSVPRRHRSSAERTKSGLCGFEEVRLDVRKALVLASVDAGAAYCRDLSK